MSEQKKPRKPKTTTDFAHLTDWGCIIREKLELRDMKRLYLWLGKAIKYLEAK